MGIEGKKLSRRALLLGAAAAAAGAYLLRGDGEGVQERTEQGRESHGTIAPLATGVDQKKYDESFLDVEKRPKTYDMGRLAGVKFGDLLSAYTIGEERPVMRQESIDFRYQQAQLWKRKLEFVKKGTHPELYPAVYETAKQLFGSYDPGSLKRMTLSQYRDRADASVREVRRDFAVDDVARLESFKSFKPVQLQLLRKFEKAITGNALIAYALTEMMPTKGGNSKTGVETLDFLLRNAGVEFVDRIPAVHDSRVSVGAYQFTSDAILRSGTTHNGASVIQRVVKKTHIPESVVQLAGDTHHKAAYLYAVYNLAVLVRKLGEGRSAQLLATFSKLPQDIVTEYIASAHHLPAKAMDAFNAYAEEFIAFQNTPPRERKKAQSPPRFVSYCEKKGVGEYCRKTRGNVEALRGRV